MLICQHPGEEGGEEAEGRHLVRQQAARRRVPCARAGEMSGRTAVQGGWIGMLLGVELASAVSPAWLTRECV